MAGKTTSAGYRIPSVTSEYHQKCISANVKTIQEATQRSASDKTFSYGAYRNCNAVAQEQIWTEYVQNETKMVKKWKKDWTFLTDFDHKGNPRPKKKLPEKVSFYESKTPNTTSKHFGSRVKHPDSREMYRLEMTSCYRKRKTDLEKYYS